MKHDVMIQIFSNNKQKNFLWSKRRTEKHVILIKKCFLVKDRGYMCRLHAILCCLYALYNWIYFLCRLL